MSKYVSYFFVVLIFSSFGIEELRGYSIEKQNSSLILLHVLFRHGDRTPDLNEIYPKDPYLSHFTNEYGDLTNDGKYRVYLIGETLRERYDHFLEAYTRNSLIATTTNYDRTKISCELLLAGLYPPTSTQKWNKNLNWQPIPYNYKEFEYDFLLGEPKYTCANYLPLYHDYLKSPEGFNVTEERKDLYEYLSKHTGWNVTTPREVYQLQFLLTSQEALGYKLPEWTKAVWPKDVIEAAVEHYYIETATQLFKRLTGGYLLKKIIEDSKLKITGKLPEERKIYLYSAHENNIAYLLILLKVFHPHVPPYGSYVIVEVHKIKDDYGFMFFYQDYSTTEPKLLKLPDCETFCPIDKFVEIVGQYLPTEDDCKKYFPV